MTETPFPFETDATLQLSPGIYQPVRQNPSGLRVAWLLFAATVVLWAIIYARGVITPLLMQGTVIVLFFIALGITFSQWLDRRTSIRLADDGIHYKSPLRQVSRRWEEIDELWCGPIQGGWRFLVSGSSAAFRFQSLVEIRSGTGRSIRSGYPEGLKIAQMVIARAELKARERRDQVLVYRKEG